MKSEADSVVQTIKKFVEGYPDIGAMVAEGKLLEKGGGWYEITSSKVLEELGSYAYACGTPKVIGNKTRVKLRKLPAGLSKLAKPRI